MREQADSAKVERYRQMLRAGSQPPPLAIMPYGKRWFLMDGHHRLRAAQLEGCLRIAAEVVTLT